MTDRFRVLDLVDPPEQWAEIKRRVPNATMPPTPSKLRRLTAAAVALAVALGGFAILTWAIRPARRQQVPLSRPDNVFTLPPPSARSAVLPVVLEGGRPIFLVASDGSAQAIDARSTDSPFGIAYLVAWCPSNSTFEDTFHGARFAPNGARLEGPASGGLTRYLVHVVPGASRRVQVERRLPPASSAVMPADLRPECTNTSEMVLPATPAPTWTSPQAAAAAHPVGFVTIRGALVLGPGSAAMCPIGEVVAKGCAREGAPVGGIDTEGLFAHLKGPVNQVTIRGLWIARVRGDHLTDLAEVPLPGGAFGP
jgi:hypothetical protein